MSFKPFPFALALGLSLAPGLAPAAPASADEVRTFEYARTLYTQHRWSGAFGRFAALADRGHPEAAQIALFMLRHGAPLYQTAWSATQPQIAQWPRLAQGNRAPLVADGAD